VEINLPASGREAQIQGVLARDPGGKLWVLHKGRMSIPGLRITEQMFADASRLAPVSVRFDDCTVETCYQVANLDAPSREVQNQTAEFV
jgi:hypothetical protein